MKQDELDGLIYFPTRDSNESIAIIIEAKNYYNGENGAERQLRSTDYRAFKAKLIKLHFTLTIGIRPLLLLQKRRKKT